MRLRTKAILLMVAVFILGTGVNFFFLVQYDGNVRDMLGGEAVDYAQGRASALENHIRADVVRVTAVAHLIRKPDLDVGVNGSRAALEAWR
ncbi:MAG: hypothetical protein SVU32_06790 [Candidatus Nanohaloarchaea archaeon]|nr:hypothetical protein [Candidatus Nanohaloarchaea archaeon]